VPSGGKLEGTGAVKVAGTGALTAAGEVKVAALTTAGTVTVPEGGKLEATGTVKVESTATLEVKGTVTAAEVTVQGTVTVAEDAALETTLGTVTVENGGSLDAKGEVTVPEGEKIAAENGAKISGVDEDKIDVQDGAAVEKKYSASSVDSLAAAIASAKAAATGSVTGVVQLTEAFYTDANSKNAALVIDAGETDNATHYIVRGLGIGSGKPALSAAILLANDNVTLEDVKIQVTLDNNAVQSAWTTATNYRSSLFIGRASSGTTLLTEANAASNNVTVRNCDITATGLSNFTAGIYVWGGSGDDAIFPSQNISITDNTIRATGYNGNAVQGINIRVWHPLIKITGNAITARYGTKGDPKYSGKPASAIFMNRVYGAALTGSNADPVISGNTLTSDVYSFYINACETITVEADDHKGVGALRSDNFAVAETTWALSTATDKDSTYKKLFNALVANTGSNGFGSVSVPYSTNAFEFEHYEINNGVIVAISVLGDHISNGAYSGGSETNKFGTTTNGVDYGRKLASAPTDYSNSQNHFCFGPNAAGTGYQYATSYVYSDNN
jgi:hypothetical protein